MGSNRYTCNVFSSFVCVKLDSLTPGSFTSHLIYVSSCFRFCLVLSLRSLLLTTFYSFLHHSRLSLCPLFLPHSLTTHDFRSRVRDSSPSWIALVLAVTDLFQAFQAFQTTKHPRPSHHHLIHSLSLSFSLSLSLPHVPHPRHLLHGSFKKYYSRIFVQAIPGILLETVLCCLRGEGCIMQRRLHAFIVFSSIHAMILTP